MMCSTVVSTLISFIARRCLRYWYTPGCPESIPNLKKSLFQSIRGCDDIVMITSKNPAKEDHADNQETCQELDVEKTARPEAVERQVSEEPYSVFSKGMKAWIIILVSISALISPFGAAMFLPALNVISDVLDITPVQVNISLTTFMVRMKDFTHHRLS